MSGPRIAALVVLIVLAVASRYLLLRDEGDRDPDRLPDARSDYSLVDFELIAMNSHGQPSFRLAAPRLERDPEDESAHVSEPRIALFEAAEPVWHLEARSGWVRGDGEEIRLAGDVSALSTDEPPVAVGATALTIFPELRTLTSREAVTLRKDNNAMTGVGLRADLRSNRWELLSDVKASFLPADR